MSFLLPKHVFLHKLTLTFFNSLDLHIVSGIKRIILLQKDSHKTHVNAFFYHSVSIFPTELCHQLNYKRKDLSSSIVIISCRNILILFSSTIILHHHYGLHSVIGIQTNTIFFTFIVVINYHHHKRLSSLKSSLSFALSSASLLCHNRLKST